MKKLIVISFLSVLWVSVLQSQINLYVKEKSNFQTAFNLNELRKLNFSSGNLIVTMYNGSSQSFTLTNLRYLSFQDKVTSTNNLQKDEPETLILYPNPANNELNIQSPLFESGFIYTEIYSLDGKVLIKQQKYEMLGKTLQINVQKLPRGLYILRITNSKQIQTTRFIKD